ncbi:hypothetical protein UA08_04436, partial [Talaromyces atroroseus]
ERYDATESADDNDDEKQSFLGMRPEMPPLDINFRGSNSDNEGGASGLATKEALLSTALSYGGGESELQQVQQRLRSRSVSPSVAEKTFELAPRSQSRPSSPGSGEEQKSKPRRLSVLRASDSPTAVPLHFRKPPTSPSGTKRISLSSPSQSPNSPKHSRRPNSIEFKNVREIRPLWLVERHSSTKFDAEPEGPLPSLPSSKTSSRVASVEDLRAAYDENAVADFDISGGPSYSLGRKPVDLRISTDQLPAEEDDFLNSQQATPTAETYNSKQFGPPPIKKEKPKYEFHSPSELLQDLGAYYDPQIPEPPESMDQLPPVAGSDVAEKGIEKTLEQLPVNTEIQLEKLVPAAEDGVQSNNKSNEKASFLLGAGFASVVDAAVSTDSDSHDKDAKSSNDHELPMTEHGESELLTKDDADEGLQGVSTEHVQQQEQASSMDHAEPSGNPGDVVNSAVPATSSGQSLATTENKADVSKETQYDVHSSGETLAGIVDAAVATAVDTPAISHAKSTQHNISKHETDLSTDDPPDEKEKAASEVEETKWVSGTSSGQLLMDDTKEVAEDVIREAEQPLSTVETEQVEAVTASAETDTRPSPSAEHDIKDTNNQAPHVIAEPEDEDFSSTTSKSPKKKKKNKKKSQSLSEPAAIEAKPAAPVDELVGPSTTEEPQSLDETGKSFSDIACAAMLSEQVEDIENGPGISVVPQGKNGQGNKEEPDKLMNSLQEPELAEEQTSAVVVTDQIPGIPSDVPDSEQQQWSLDNVTEEAPAQEEATEMMPPDEKTEILQNENRKLPETSKVPQQISVEDSIKEDQTLPHPEPPAVDDPVESSEVILAQPSDDKEEEQPALTQSGKKSKKQKKKKKGKSLSVDESPNEVPQELFATSQAQSESAAIAASVEPAIAQGGEATMDKNQDVVGLEPFSSSADPEASQSHDIDTQSKETEEIHVEDPKLEPDVLCAQTEVSQNPDVAVISGDQEALIAPGFSVVPETGVEGELHDESAEIREPVQLDESLVARPAQAGEIVEPETSNIAHVSIDPGLSEAPLLEQPAGSSDKQSVEAIEVADSAVKEEKVPFSHEETSKPASFAAAKSKKKKNKKNKRLSLVEEPEITTEITETGSSTPVEPEKSGAPEQESTALVESSLPPIVATTPIPTEPEPFAPADPEITLVEAAVPTEASADLPTSTDTIVSPFVVDAESPTQTEPPTAVSDEGSIMKAQEISDQGDQTKDLALSQPELQREENENPDDQSTAQELVPSQTGSAVKPTLAETEDFQVANSKAKRKKDKKKDKKKKAAEALPGDDEPFDNHVNENPTEPVEATISQDPEPEGLMPTEQFNLIDPKTEDVKEDSPKSQVLEPPTEEAKTVDIGKDGPWDLETSNSKTKEDKEKDAAATIATLTVDEEPNFRSNNGDGTETPEAVSSENLEQVESISIGQPSLDEQKRDNVTEESQSPESPADAPTDAPTDAPAEESKPIDNAEDNSLSAETSKSKKKKDKKKKKAMEALLMADKLSDRPVTEDTKKSVEIVTPEEPEQIESVSAKEPTPDGRTPVNVVEDTGAESHPQEILAETAAEIPAEEKQTVDVVQDSSQVQETSKAKKKKDKKKKKAAESLRLEEEQPDKPAIEYSTELVEPPAAEVSEQSNADEVKMEVKVHDYSTDPQPPGAPAEEIAKAVDITKEDGSTQESKSKKKKDKKKKKVAAPSLDDELYNNNPDNENITELDAVPSAKGADAEEVPNTEIGISETPAEEAMAATIPEDGALQEISKSKKDKKNRQSIQLVAAQEEGARDASADVPEIATPVESSSPAVEDTTKTKEEQKKDDIADLQLQEIVLKESLPLQQPENLEGEDLKSKAGKSKKKKDKKNKSKDEPFPWDAEPVPEPEKPQGTVTGEPAASVDVPEPTESGEFSGPIINVNSTSDDAKAAEPAVTAALKASDEPKEPELTEATEAIKAMGLTEEITESIDPPAVETSELTSPQPEEPIELQSSEPAENALQADFQMPVKNMERGSLISSVVTEPNSSERGAEVTEPTEVATLTEPELADSDEPIETIQREIVEPVKTAGLDAAIDTKENTESIEDGNEISRRPSKKSKKKKKRDLMALDEAPRISSEQQDPLAITPTVEGSYENALVDPLREEKPFEEVPTDEGQGQQERGLPEHESIHPRDPDAEMQDSSAAETPKPLTAKEKRKEEAKNSRTLDLSISELDPARVDETVDVSVPTLQPVKDDEQNLKEARQNEVVVAGKKKGKKNKRQSVNWEEDVIQAATENEPKLDEAGEIDNAEAVKETSLYPATENIDSNPELHGIESAPQETLVEVDGKETFQSSDETHTDKKEKDFDWTDNMVSPQVQSQTEEFRSPVPSPTSNNHEDNDQPRPSEDDIQSGEFVTTSTLPENQPPIFEKESIEATEQPTVYLQPIDPEAEDADITTTKTGKGDKGRQKKIDESLITEEDSSMKKSMVADDGSDSQVLPYVNKEQVGEPGSSFAQDVLAVSESPRDLGAEKGLEHVGSSKKKGKKKKKADTYSFADFGESVDERCAANADHGPANASGDLFNQKELSVDNNENQLQEDTTVTSDVHGKDDAKDLIVVEAPHHNEVVPKEHPDNEVSAVSESPPSRNLTKKEKKKLKKGKKAVEIDEEEPTAGPITNEYTEKINTRQLVEAVEENVDNTPAVSSESPWVNDQPAEQGQILDEPTVDVKEQQVAEVDVEHTPSQEEPFARNLSKKEKRKKKKRTTEDVQGSQGMGVDSVGIGGQLDNPETIPIITEEQDYDRGPVTEEAATRARALEKEADLDVAASLFGDPPGPENSVSRQSSQEQKGKKSKKDKRHPQRENDNLEETVETQDGGDVEISAGIENYNIESQLTEPVEEKLLSWPLVEPSHDSGEKLGEKKRALNEEEPELEQPKQEPVSITDDFPAEEVRNEARDLGADKVTAGGAQATSNQREDVDIAVEAAMAAAGFLPSSAAPKPSSENDNTTGIESTEEMTGTKNLAGVYKQSDSLNDTGRSLETADASFETTRGRSTTNKIASIFPGLERVTYRRPSPKSHEKQATEVITVEERSQPPPEAQFSDEILNTTTAAGQAHVSAHEHAAPETESAPKDRSSSLLFDSSPSTRLAPTPDVTKRASSPTIRLQHSSGSLHRTKSIHGHHTGHTHGWQLDDEVTPTKRTSSQSPQPLRAEHVDISPPRTPLDPIKEHDGPYVSSPSPRLVMGEGPYILERPDSRSSARSMRSLRKANRSISADLRAVASPDNQFGATDDQDWPRAEEHDKKTKSAGRQEAGWAAPSATDRSQPPSDPQRTEDDDDDLDRQHLENIPSSSTYDPVTDKGKRPVRGMTDVYEAWGETPNSPRSPTRPPSVRRRQSMQHLQELELRLDQLISENRLLAAAKDEAEHKLSRAGVARRKSDQALNSSNADLRDKEAEISRLTSSLEWMQSEVQRLTQENETLNATHVELTASHAREVDGLRTRQLELATGMESIVRDQIGGALAEKDAELRQLRDELAAARQTVQELQQQIVSATADDVLSIHDEDYFDNACQRLCQHVQQWVLRFSKHSDLRRCRPLAEVRNTVVADRFDNAILDGSDVDTILSDRVRRRDVFVAVVMAMIWEYIFTRYLFGMDRDQRQKLKALEKQLSDIGPRRAVAHWRALTLTLLAKRPSFAEQRVKDTEAVALEIMETLSQLLPPPQSAQSQLLESLRGVLRRAANLSIEMRTQRAEYVMLPPLQPEFDSQGDLARQVSFNASLMNERSGLYSSNEALEAQGTAVRLVLFPLVVKKGTDLGDGDEEIVVCPAQVLVAWPDNERPRERDRMSALGNRSVSSVVPSVDMGNMF